MNPTPNLPADLMAAPWPDDEIDEAVKMTGDEDRPRFTIADRGQAEWAMRKLAAARSAAAEAKESAAEWRAQIDRWEADELQSATATAAFFEGLLASWLRELRDADPSVKSVKLPSGVVKSTTSRKPRTKVVNPAAVLAALDAEFGSDVVDALGATTVTRKPVAAKLQPDDPAKLVEVREIRDGDRVTYVAVPGDPNYEYDADDPGSDEWAKEAAIPGIVVVPAGTTTFKVEPS